MEVIKMKKSEVKNLPKAIRKRYNLTNGVRTVTMFIGWILSALLFIYALKSGEKGFANVVFAPVFGGGFIHGLFHAEFLFKKAFKNLGLIIGFFASGVVFLVSAYSGFIFLIVDTVLFILKKPLIYPFEDKNFLAVENIMDLIENGEIEAYEYELPADFSNDIDD